MGSTKDDDWETSIFFDGKVGNQLELRFLEFPNHMIGEQLQKIELEHTLGPKTLGSLYPFHQFDPSLQGSQCQKGPQTTRLVEMGGQFLGNQLHQKMEMNYMIRLVVSVRYFWSFNQVFGRPNCRA